MLAIKIQQFAEFWIFSLRNVANFINILPTGGDYDSDFKMTMAKPFHILVVDDDPNVLRLTCRVLSNAGFSICTASSGMEALESVLTNRPLLLLLDRQLTDLDGLEVNRRIKAIPALADVFVVILSGAYVDTDDQAIGLEAGVDGYIARPVGNRELVARVEAFVRIARLNSALREQAKRLRISNLELIRLNRELKSQLDSQHQNQTEQPVNGRW